MAKKSAFESLYTRLEGSDAGDTNIDINVIVDADEEAVEDVLETQETTEEAAEADAIVEQEEDAQQEAEDMAEMAAVLRKHGLTRGMAAVLAITMPLRAYGISMPATESMDASGRNQALADRIAVALEEKAEGFWAKTKQFFIRLWERICDFFARTIPFWRSMVQKVERAKKSLKDRVPDSDLMKDVKIPYLKNGDNIAQGAKAIKGISAAGYALCAMSPDKHPGGDVFIVENDLKLLTGYKYTVEDINGVKTPTGVEEDTKDYLDDDDRDMKAGDIEDLQKGWFEAALAVARTLSEVSESISAAKKKLALDEKNAKVDGAMSSQEKEIISAWRKAFTLYLSCNGKVVKSAKTYCAYYIKACAAARKGSKAA